MNHSSIGLFLFSLTLFIHVRKQHDSAFAILDRSFLFSRADRCVLKYLEKVENEKVFELLPYLVDRCAVNQYFKLEEYGVPGSSIYNSFPVFKSHLEQCTNFVFFGTTSDNMSTEVEIFDSTEFKLIGCSSIIIGTSEKTSLANFENYIQVEVLNSEILDDLLVRFEQSGNLIFEHLFISETMTDLRKFYKKLLNLRETYRVLPCQITIRFPRSEFSNRDLVEFSQEVLHNDPYTLMNIKNNMENDFVELYLFASAEYHCMMRYF